MAESTDFVANQMILFVDDSLEVHYSDGSVLQLTSCGSSFTHHPSRSSCALLQKSFHQRTQFVTSTYKDQVKEALAFRNKFAEHPYVCKDLFDKEDIIRRHEDIFEVAWPTKNNVGDFVLKDQNGETSLSSVDGHATMVLLPNRNSFVVKYICKVSQPANREKKLTSKNDTCLSSSTGAANTLPLKEVSSLSISHASELNLTDAMKKNPNDSMYGKHLQEHSIQNSTQMSVYPQSSEHLYSKSDSKYEGRWDYVWIVQHHSIQNFPKHWQYPLQLLIETRKKKCQIQANVENMNGTTEHTVSCKSDYISSRLPQECMYCPIPRALSLNCLAPEKHRSQRLLKNDEGKNVDMEADTLLQGRIKLIYTNGILYRFIWDPSRILEVYPGDGSILKSSGLSGHYFHHLVFTDHMLEERMYAVSTPPPHVPGMAYSVSSLIKKAARFLDLMMAVSEVLIVEPCWRQVTANTQSYIPKILLEECVVPDVGRFSAYSNGEVRIVFADRAILDCTADLSPRLQMMFQRTSYDENDQNIVGTLNYESKARLMRPDGYYEVIPTCINEPSQYGKYASAAIEWIKWVNTHPDIRSEFGNNNHAEINVNKELKKISCFNYILEENVLPQLATAKPIVSKPMHPLKPMIPPNHESVDSRLVEQILTQNEQTLKELDSFLQASKLNKKK